MEMVSIPHIISIFFGKFLGLMYGLVYKLVNKGSELLKYGCQASITDKTVETFYQISRYTGYHN